MRVLILDHYYPAFIERIYGATIGLAAKSFDEQEKRIDAGLFGETQFQVAALRRLGHEALHMPINVPVLIEAWARDRGIRLTRGGRVSLRRLGPLAWLDRRTRRGWLTSYIRAVASAFEPDVVQVQCMDALPAEIVAGLRAPRRLLIGQTAAPQPIWSNAGFFDLIFSSLPNFVEKFRRSGTTAHLLPLAFDPKVAESVQSATRDVETSFVGGLTAAHRRRLDTISALARETDVDIWSADTRPDWIAAHPRARVHGPAWWRDMYHALARSRITVNVHGEHAEGFANNLRLYEATGMGALLITEDAPNLRELFEPGREVVTYRDATELAKVVRHFRGHPAEAAQIATAGRTKTNRDHTWEVRMGQWVNLVEAAQRGRV